MPSPAPGRASYAEYLRGEEGSDVRHEYIDGAVLAMAGGSGAHACLKANLTVTLGAALRGRPCRVRDVDQRVRVVATGLATYPDLSVVCGPRVPDVEDAHALTNPTLLAEVLSPGTAGYDRGEKFDHYQRIPTLRQYLLVDSERRHVDVYTRLDDGRWAREGFASGAIPLASIDVSLDLDELYAGWEEERAIDAAGAAQVR